MTKNLLDLRDGTYSLNPIKYAYGFAVLCCIVAIIK